MNTNFFKQIADLGFEHVTFDVKTDVEGNQTVFVTPKIMAKDKALQSLKPIFLTAKPEELDEAFIATISAPMKLAAGLHTNIKAFEDSVDKANKESDLAKKHGEKIKAAEEKFKKIIEPLKTDDDWLKAKDKIEKGLDELNKVQDGTKLASTTDAKLKKIIENSANVGLFDMPAAASEPKAPVAPPVIDKSFEEGMSEGEPRTSVTQADVATGSPDDPITDEFAPVPANETPVEEVNVSHELVSTDADETFMPAPEEDNDEHDEYDYEEHDDEPQ